MNQQFRWMKRRVKKFFLSFFSNKKASKYVAPIIDAASNKGYVENYSNKADSLHLDIKSIYEEDLQDNFLKIMKKLSPHFRGSNVRLAIDFQEEGFYGKTNSFYIIGTSYPETKLKLIAGDVHRVEDSTRYKYLYDYAVAEPGMYYRDFEKKTLEKNLYMPSYPASREMCAIGGIISNNAGGERTLRYGKTNKYLLGVNLILADGKEYYFEKLNKTELDKKMTLETFEGQVYKKTFELISKNKELIEKSRPKVSKNSSGYNIWDVWDGHNFDLTQLICGAQGTLGIITRAKLGLVKRKKYNHLYVVFFKTLLTLPQFTREVLRLKPTSLEVTDDHTFKIYLRYAKEMAEILGSKSIFSTIKLFMPEFLLTIKSGVPKLILLVEFEGNEEVSVLKNIEQIKQLVKQYKLSGRFCKTDLEAQKYWKLRRDTFKLLREKIKDKHATPFIDDISINPSYLPEFIPALTKILDEHKILYTISGHLGDGNLHVIPLMDLSKEEERKKIYEVTDLVYDLILKHQGTLSAEHNDGLIRSPYLEKEFGLKVYNLFKQIKETFDPDNIFNPHKKIGVTKEYAMSHMIKDESYIQKHPHEKI